ncbi:MAG: AMP-binding protein, partial [Flammeovirgaceae bacterium]
MPASGLVALLSKSISGNRNSVAVIGDDRTLTYDDLDKLSSQVSQDLISNGITSDDVVALILDRGPDVIVSMLGVLKASAAFMPVELSDPAPRIKRMLEDARVKMVVTQSHHLMKVGDLWNGNLCAIDLLSDNLDSHKNLSVPDNPDSLAYVIFTSGSTGVPKGVGINRANLHNYITWAKHFYFGNNDVGPFGLFTAPSFDLSLTSVFLPLLFGSSVKVYSNTDAAVCIKDVFAPGSGIKCVK